MKERKRKGKEGEGERRCDKWRMTYFTMGGAGRSNERGRKEGCSWIFFWFFLLLVLPLVLRLVLLSSFILLRLLRLVLDHWRFDPKEEIFLKAKCVCLIAWSNRNFWNWPFSFLHSPPPSLLSLLLFFLYFRFPFSSSLFLSFRPPSHFSFLFQKNKKEKPQPL